MVGLVLQGSSATLSSTTLKVHYKCFLICVVVALSNLQYGFDLTIVNGFQAMPGFLRVFGVEKSPGKFAIQTTFQQLITSLLQVGLIVASLAIGPFSTVLGRRAGLGIACLITFVAVTMQIVVTVRWPLYIGRLLLGIANGCYVNFTILYISEVAPAELRGCLGSLIQPGLSFGNLFAAIVANALHTNLSKHSYQIQLAILYAIPLLLFVALPFLPETPRWLLLQGEEDSARRSLTRLRPSSFTASQIDEELAIIQEAIRIERKIASSVVWKDIWKGADLRRTLLSSACATFHPSCGINFVIAYATFFFLIAGVKQPFLAAIYLHSVNVFGALCSLPLSRRFGRRPLMLLGFATCTVCMFAIAIIYTVSPDSEKSGKALVALLCIFFGMYSATIGPLSWVATGELPSNHLRSYTFGVAMTIGFIFAWLVVFTMPYFINADSLNWGGKVAWLWGPSNLISFVFTYFFVPETRGRALEELDELFYNKVPARQFSSYKLQNKIIVEDVYEDEKSDSKVDVVKDV